MKKPNNLCPYPFDMSLVMKPFPKGFDIPKFDKYYGMGNPEDHIKEFQVHFMEVTYDDNHVYEHVVETLEEYVPIINIKGANGDYGVTTCSSKVTITGPSQPPREFTSNTRSIPHGYNVLDQLKRTQTQISIMELLKISSSH